MQFKFKMYICNEYYIFDYGKCPTTYSYCY